MSSDNLNRWLTGSPGPSTTPVVVKKKKGSDNNKELLEYLLDWIRILLMGGSPLRQALPDIENDIQKLADENGLEISDTDWITKRVEEVLKENNSKKIK